MKLWIQLYGRIVQLPAFARLAWPSVATEVTPTVSLVSRPDSESGLARLTSRPAPLNRPRLTATRFGLLGAAASARRAEARRDTLIGSVWRMPPSSPTLFELPLPLLWREPEVCELLQLSTGARVRGVHAGHMYGQRRTRIECREGEL